MQIGNTHIFNKLLSLIAVIVLSSVYSYAQDDCAEKLKESAEMYDQGLYNQVIEILTDRIVNCDYSGTELEQAKKLIIGSYFELDELEKGTELTEKFLKKNPIYTINNSSDPALFIKEVKSFEITPRYKLSLNVGFNKLYPNILYQNTIWESADYTAPYVTKFKPHFTVAGEWNALRNLSLKVGIRFAFHSYERQITGVSDFLMDYTENYTCLSIPAEIRYAIDLKQKWSPVLIGGIYYSQLINPTANISVSGNIPEKAENGIPTKDFRTMNNYGFLYGGAVNYTSNKITYSIEAVYFTDIQDFSIKTSNSMDHEPAVDYYYIDDNFKSTNLALSVGIAYTFSYNIKKKY